MSELKKYTHANGRDSTMTETSLPLEFLNKNDIWYKASDVDAQLQNYKEVVPRSRYDACNQDWLDALAKLRQVQDRARVEIENLNQTLLASIKERNSQLQPVRWTREKPTVPGWYWHRIDKNDEPCFAHIFQAAFEQKLYVGFGDTWESSHVPLFYQKGEWAGPLATPLEPTA